MLSLHLSKPALFVVACCFVGCSSGPSDPGSQRVPGAGTTTSGPFNQGQAQVDASVGAGDGGASPVAPPPGAGASGSTGTQEPPDPTNEPATAADAGGGDGAIPTECDLDGGCVSKCIQPSAVCAVVSRGFLCELDGFVGASTEVTCGQRTVLGTACCGGCGCVPVEVFFDGTTCWQGIPACTGPVLFDPHAQGASDAGWSVATHNGVAGTFYLGTMGPDAGDALAVDGGREGASAGPGGDATVDAMGSDDGAEDGDAGADGDAGVDTDAGAGTDAGVDAGTAEGPDGSGL
jgi:hypothetical protein